jgi:hypothetical protein
MDYFSTTCPPFEGYRIKKIFEKTPPSLLTRAIPVHIMYVLEMNDVDLHRTSSAARHLPPHSLEGVICILATVRVGMRLRMRDTIRCRPFALIMLALPSHEHGGMGTMMRS